MSIEIQSIPVQTCEKCGRKNPAKILGNGTIKTPEKCRNVNCRNILDRERVRTGIKKRIEAAKNNLSPHPENLRPHPENILKYNEERKKKKQYHFCPKCELFFNDGISLQNHNSRRHERCCSI